MGVVKEFEAAFNRQDVGALVGLFTESATYADSFYGEHAGRAKLSAMFERMFREGKDYAWSMTAIVESPACATAEWAFGYVVTDVDSAAQRVAVDDLCSVPGTIRCRVLY